MLRFLSALLLGSALSTSGFALSIKTSQDSLLNLQANLAKFHQYDMHLDLAIKVKSAFSIIALSSPILFQVKCGEDLIAETSLLYDDSMENKTFTLSLTATDVRTKCPNGQFSLLLNPNGVELEADLTHVVYQLNDLGEDNEGFIERYKSEHAKYVSDMIYFHGEMSGSIVNRESFHCLIKGYEKDVLKEEIVTALIAEYKKIFSIEYVADDIDCQSPVSLSTVISSCQTKPRTSFCANYRLYLESIAWLKGTQKSARDRKAKVQADMVERSATLQKIIEEIDADLKTSVAQTGA